MLVVVSLDWMSFRAHSLMLSIPSFSAYQDCERQSHLEHLQSLPENTSNEGNIVVVTVLQGPPLSCLQS